MQNKLIELSDREIDKVSGGVVVLGGTITNLSGSTGTGSVSVAVGGGSFSFGGTSSAGAGSVAGPTAIFF